MIDKEWLAQQYKSGLSGRAIALSSGYPISTIRSWLIKLGIWQYGVHRSTTIDKRRDVKRSPYIRGPSWSDRKVAAIIARRKNQSST